MGRKRSLAGEFESRGDNNVYSGPKINGSAFAFEYARMCTYVSMKVCARDCVCMCACIRESVCSVMIVISMRLCVFKCVHKSIFWCV